MTRGAKLWYNLGGIHIKFFSWEGMTVEVYETKPEQFKAGIEIAASYVEIDGQMLLLECASSKQEPGKWGVPAGKLEMGELPKQAAKRELFEETGILVETSDIYPIGCLYFRKPEIDYVYHLFQITLRSKPEICLSSEHLNYLWATEEEIQRLPLMAGGFKALEKYRSSVNKGSFTEEKTMKNYEVIQKPAIFVIGIDCRTSNAKEAGPQDIPKLWERFYSEDVMNQIPNKISNEVVALYCDYEGDHTQPYSVVIGCPVNSIDTIPEKMVAKKIPATSYAVFRAIGEHPKALIETWGHIWKESDLARTYTGDFELYGDKFVSGHPKELEVFIAVR